MMMMDMGFSGTWMPGGVVERVPSPPPPEVVSPPRPPAVVQPRALLSGTGFDRILGRSARLSHTVQKARMLSQVDAAVLLQGETGVGKEVFARAIHESGKRRHAPFVAVNCGGLPRELLASELFGYVDGAFTGARRSGMVGKIEAAHGGTLFLDEIGEMPLDLQPYLLRVLEGGEVYPLGSSKPRTVQFRLVAACNRDLRAETLAGRFRPDLFYRISVTSLPIPALRERKEDLPLLVEHFAREAAARHRIPVRTFAPEVLVSFARYPWPGNLRELRNVVEIMSVMARGEVVDLEVLPPEFTDTLASARSPEGADGELAPARWTATGLEDVEKDVIGGALRQHQGNLARAAKDLRISRSTLYLKLKKYGLQAMLTQVRFKAR